MTATSVPVATFSQILWPVHQSSARLWRTIILAFGGSLLLWLSAKIQVPMWPVPMTMQTYVVLILGASMGRNLAAATVAFYLIQGIAGLPVFAGPVAGPAYLLGPTGGYLIGFVVAAYLVGWMSERGADRKLFLGFLMMMLGHVVIFAFGLTWLLILNPNNLVFGESLMFVYEKGLALFSVATILKTSLATLTMLALWSFAKSKTAMNR